MVDASLDVEDETITAEADDGVDTFSVDSHDVGVYANEEYANAHGETVTSHKGDSSDEIDPRKLVRDPTLSEIRWYYRRSIGGPLVDKPIEDAFKNGFEFRGDGADEARSILDDPTWSKEGHDGFVGAHLFAEKKARRDGFALLFLGTRERMMADGVENGVHRSPISEDVDVQSISHLKVFTIDDLDGSVPHDQVQRGTGLDEGQYEVRETGIVVNTDINSPNYKDPVGYVIEGSPNQFVHRDRVLHYVWNATVDGDYNHNNVKRWNGRESTLGAWEGDSVLIRSYDLLKGVTKGNWAVMQAVFRHASHMYSVELPEDANDEDMEAATRETRNINSKSSLVTPHGYEVEQHESGNEMDPSQHFDVIFDQVCAVHEMTRSVLFGTQTGTVSGSETDIKNYFNKVERYRSNRAEDKIFEFLTRSKAMTDNRTSDDFEYSGVDIEWGPLFKVDREARMSIFQTQSQAIATLIGQYVITPDEARELLNEEWAEVDYEDLSEDQMDELDRIRLATSGQGESAIRSEGEYTNAPEPKEEGGRPEGSRQGAESSSATPNN